MNECTVVCIVCAFQVRHVASRALLKLGWRRVVADALGRDAAHQSSVRVLCMELLQRRATAAPQVSPGGKLTELEALAQDVAALVGNVHR